MVFRPTVITVYFMQPGKRNQRLLSCRWLYKRRRALKRRMQTVCSPKMCFIANTNLLNVLLPLKPYRDFSLPPNALFRFLITLLAFHSPSFSPKKSSSFEMLNAIRKQANKLPDFFLHSQFSRLSFLRKKIIILLLFMVWLFVCKTPTNEWKARLFSILWADERH